MTIQICVGSSCHLKGSMDIVELVKKAVAENNLESDIAVAGSFCIGKCNRDGVSVQVDEKIYTGVTVEGFDEFFKNNVLGKMKGSEGV